MDINGFIFVWHHNNDETPDWLLENIEYNYKNKYRSTIEMTVNSHIQVNKLFRSYQNEKIIPISH